MRWVRASWTAGMHRVSLLGQSGTGQATSEYLVTSAMLVGVGLLIAGIMSGALRTFMRGVALAVRTVAP